MLKEKTFAQRIRRRGEQWVLKTHETKIRGEKKEATDHEADQTNGPTTPSGERKGPKARRRIHSKSRRRMFVDPVESRGH